MKDFIQIKGDLRITLRDVITGIIHTDRLEKNLVVAVGKELIASRLASASDAVVGWMAVGSGNTSPVAGNTTLETEVARVATTVSGGTPISNTIEFVGIYPAGTATGSLEEAGLFNGSSAGTMLSRTTYSVINKGAADEMTITWTITIG